MKITLNCTLRRPANYLHNNAAAGVLVEKLDGGMFLILLIALEEKESANVIVSWELEEDEPILDEDRAVELVIAALTAAMGCEWAVQGDVECVDFEPDTEDVPEPKNLGDRPFGAGR